MKKTFHSNLNHDLIYLIDIMYPINLDKKKKEIYKRTYHEKSNMNIVALMHVSRMF